MKAAVHRRKKNEERSLQIWGEELELERDAKTGAVARSKKLIDTVAVLNVKTVNVAKNR